MSSFPTNPSLEAAIAATEDEAPRLIYADWLDEHGDPLRAEFIRVQCRLADLSPAEPDWADLIERQSQLEGMAGLYPRFFDLKPPVPDRFYFGTFFSNELWEEPFRRGLPYFIDCQLKGQEWTKEVTARVAADLERLVETTSIRGFHPYEIPSARLADLLAMPAVAKLSGLTVSLGFGLSDREWAATYRLLGTSPAVRNLRHLSLYDHGIPQAGVVELATAEALGNVRQLTILGLAAPASDLRRLTGSAWFQGLRRLRIHLPDPDVAAPMASGLGELLNLHTLHFREFAAPAVRELAAGGFPSLARLVYDAQIDRDAAAALASGRFPRLVVLEARTRWMRNNALQELLRSDWFARLRVLDLSHNAIGAKGVVALVGHPIAQRLRVLRLGDNPLGKSGLAVLARTRGVPGTRHTGSCLLPATTQRDTDGGRLARSRLSADGPPPASPLPGRPAPRRCGSRGDCQVVGIRGTHSTRFVELSDRRPRGASPVVIISSPKSRRAAP